jgi:uncharacterized protein
VNADLATRDGVDAPWQQIGSMGREVNIVCLNAGVGVGGQFWETDLQQELDIVELNCVGRCSWRNMLFVTW